MINSKHAASWTIPTSYVPFSKRLSKSLKHWCVSRLELAFHEHCSELDQGGEQNFVVVDGEPHHRLVIEENHCKYGRSFAESASEISVPHFSQPLC